MRGTGTQTEAAKGTEKLDLDSCIVKRPGIRDIVVETDGYVLATSHTVDRLEPIVQNGDAGETNAPTPPSIRAHRDRDTGIAVGFGKVVFNHRLRCTRLLQATAVDPKTAGTQ